MARAPRHSRRFESVVILRAVTQINRYKPLFYPCSSEFIRGLVFIRADSCHSWLRSFSFSITMQP